MQAEDVDALIANVAGPFSDEKCSPPSTTAVTQPGNGAAHDDRFDSVSAGFPVASSAVNASEVPALDMPALSYVMSAPAAALPMGPDQPESRRLVREQMVAEVETKVEPPYTPAAAPAAALHACCRPCCRPTRLLPPHTPAATPHACRSGEP